MPKGSAPRMFLTVRGRTLSLPQWAAETGIRVVTLRARVYNHWPPERVVDTPPIPPAEKGRIGAPKRAIKERY